MGNRRGLDSETVRPVSDRVWGTWAAGVGHPREPWHRALVERSQTLGQALQRVGLTVTPPLDIRDVLIKLSDLTLETIAAERCAIFLTDSQASFLVPALAIARHPDEDMWRRFRSLEPIELKGAPARWRAIRAGRALVFADVRSSRLVPREFPEVFGSRSAILMPLIATGEIQGLLAVDWTEGNHEPTPDEVAVIEAIGAYAALAIRNAHLLEVVERKARTLERLVEVAGTLNSAASPRSVFDLICSAYEELLGTSHCSINLVDDSAAHRVRTVAVRGEPWFTTHPESPPAVSADEIERVRELWERTPQPVVYPSPEEQAAVDPGCVPACIQSAAIFPLFRPGSPLGCVVAGFPLRGGPGTDELDTGQALADLAATAAARAALLEELKARLERAEVLYRLSDVVAGTSELAQALQGLNEALQPALGILLISISISDTALRETVGALEPLPDELEAIEAWQQAAKKGGGPGSRASAGDTLVPVARGHKVLGVLRTRVDDRVAAAEDEGLLSVLGVCCAEVVHKASLQRELAESQRRSAVVAERERIARDLHDSVGQVLTGLGFRLAKLAGKVPDPALRNEIEGLVSMAEDGGAKIRDAIQSLAFLQVRRDGLRQALHDLTKLLESTTSITIRLRVIGDPTALPVAVENVLFRVAHEGLRNVERHAGATRASVVLAYGDEVTVSVSDDGSGLSEGASGAEDTGHFGLAGLRRMLAEVGGRLELTDLEPSGLRLEGRVPLDARVAFNGRKAGGSALTTANRDS